MGMMRAKYADDAVGIQSSGKGGNGLYVHPCIVLCCALYNAAFSSSRLLCEVG